MKDRRGAKGMSMRRRGAAIGTSALLVFGLMPAMGPSRAWAAGSEAVSSGRIQLTEGSSTQEQLFEVEPFDRFEGTAASKEEDGSGAIEETAEGDVIVGAPALLEDDPATVDATAGDDLADGNNQDDAEGAGPVTVAFEMNGGSALLQSGVFTQELVDSLGASQLVVMGDVTFDNVSFKSQAGSAMVVQGDATITIVGSCRFEGGAANAAGIQVSQNSSLRLVGNGPAASSVTALAGGKTAGQDQGSAAGIGGVDGSLQSSTNGLIQISNLALEAQGAGVQAAGVGAARGGSNGGIVLDRVEILRIQGGGLDISTDLRTDCKSNFEGGPGIGTGQKAGTSSAPIVLRQCTGGNIIGGPKAAGIGMGCWSVFDQILIEGCDLTGIQGGASSAGIGSSRYGKNPGSGSLGSIVISDSRLLDVRGGQQGAGIGTGNNLYGVGSVTSGTILAPLSVTVTNSTVEALGGNGAAGIGGGYQAAGVSVAIENSIVTAVAGGPQTSSSSLTKYFIQSETAGAAGLGAGADGGHPITGGTLSIDEASRVVAFSSGDKWAVDGFSTGREALTGTLVQLRFARNYGSVSPWVIDGEDEGDAQTSFLNPRDYEIRLGDTTVAAPSVNDYAAVGDLIGEVPGSFGPVLGGYYSVAVSGIEPGDLFVTVSGEKVGPEGMNAEAASFEHAGSCIENGIDGWSPSLAVVQGENRFDGLAFRYVAPPVTEPEAPETPDQPETPEAPAQPENPEQPESPVRPQAPGGAVSGGTASAQPETLPNASGVPGAAAPQAVAGVPVTDEDALDALEDEGIEPGQEAEQDQEDLTEVMVEDNDVALARELGVEEVKLEQATKRDLVVKTVAAVSAGAASLGALGFVAHRFDFLVKLAQFLRR